jgi:4-hydroxy-3-methylbut-2-en-1-yl diphosphate reductase
MIRGPKSQDICYATENRQMAVKGVAQFCDLLLVVGSANSSNSKRLVEVGQNYGVKSYLVNDWSDVNPAWLEGVEMSALPLALRLRSTWSKTSSAALQAAGFRPLEEVEMVEEDVRFSLPPELAGAAPQLTASPDDANVSADLDAPGGRRGKKH